MSKLNECKYQALVDQLGHDGSLNGLEYEWLALQTGLSDISLPEQWSALLTSLGYTGSIQEMQIQSWQTLSGLTTGKWNELANWFWCVNGGVYGPSVRIVPSELLPFCLYPLAGDCAAAANYTSVDNGFTNPADTWLWSLEPPVAGVVLTNATLETCTVTSTTDADVSFNLKVVATDSVSTDTAEKTTTFTHYHRLELTVQVAESLNVGCVFDSGQAAQSDCIANATYTATTNGTPTSIVWSLSAISGGTASIQSGQGTTVCVIQTSGPEPATTYTLRCDVTTQFQTAFAEATYFQNHVDQETPVFIGPNFQDAQFTQFQLITPFDVKPFFTGPGNVYDVIGTLPSGLDFTNGVLTGTPDTVEVQPITIRATNTYGVALSNEITLTVISLGYTLDVTQVAQGSCSYLYPDTECTAEGTYTATPTGYVPDTWVWQVTSGDPSTVITSGQGTDTVTVETVDGVDDNFTLYCVASNSNPQSAEDFTQFFNTHTDNSVPITNIQLVEDQAGSCDYASGASTLLDDLVAWWALDEATGTRVDSSASGYDLDEAAPVVGQVPGKIVDASSTAHQTSARLLISNATSPGLQPQDVDYTVAGWIRLVSLGNNAAAFSNYDLASAGHALWIPPGETNLYYSVAGTNLITFSPTLATWYHFVCYHDATGNIIGVRINDTTDYTIAHTTGIASGTEPFLLHNYSATGAFSIDGALDEVGVWNRLLTPAEITELYNGGNGIGYPG